MVKLYCKEWQEEERGDFDGPPITDHEIAKVVIWFATIGELIMRQVGIDQDIESRLERFNLAVTRQGDDGSATQWIKDWCINANYKRMVHKYLAKTLV